ncbi:bifunctional pyr operon transcriptional regulator/uracil phosphoribosyltransferase PyrR [Salinisphaera sp.]|uniref:bifunctional pyr operon transcriptional regulator/uracil phosphoribosyltransferase PyrR n=1 Tax=Salinisphaera sp. TaxID=1914330 RepID=UPI002D772CE3|nr:bifunctional pyr operon transcriptional regulator/uracil phosphoribosyltransferase PyrR [Salinisphaera sp.]HET7314553.1 bifunctional pyr operon transcriptional regulator/uracil phosphoribosyltransferase PyrR [Salinisphaera sp.]
MTDSSESFDVDAALAALTAQVEPLIVAHPDAVIVGVETGGAWIGRRLHDHFDLASPMCSINISFYRDDFSMVGLHPSVGPSHIPADIDGRTVILVDDVLYTGRTVRAALNELFDYGRPAAVKLAVLVDRGARELPFAPDAAGLKLDLAKGRQIKLTGPEPLRLTMR